MKRPLISIDSDDFTSPLYSLVFVSIEKVYQTLETVFHRLSIYLSIYLSNFPKNSPLRVVFYTFFSVFGYPYEKLSLVFDILLKEPILYLFHFTLGEHQKRKRQQQINWFYYVQVVIDTEDDPWTTQKF